MTLHFPCVLNQKQETKKKKANKKKEKKKYIKWSEKIP